MNGYAKVCKSYLNQLKGFSLTDQKIPLKNICAYILSLKAIIEKGYEEGLKKQLDEKTQKIFLERSENYSNRKWFSE